MSEKLLTINYSAVATLYLNEPGKYGGPADIFANENEKKLIEKEAKSPTNCRGAYIGEDPYACYCNVDAVLRSITPKVENLT